MIELFKAGGIFMTPLTLLALGIVGLIIKKGVDVFGGAPAPASKHRRAIQVILQLGILSFFLGILSQTVGLFQALQAIERVGDVSPSLVAGGLKVSMIAPLYGLIIFLVAFLSWSVLKYRVGALDA